MPRYGDLNALIRIFEAKAEMGVASGYDICFHNAAKMVELLPAADVAPVVHGKWKKRLNEKTCSECKFIYYSNGDMWNYCPNCGAKMDGEEKR